MAKKKGKNLRARATADITTAYQPQLDALDRMIAEQQAQYGAYGNQIANLYAGLQNMLAPLTGQYQGQMAGIQGAYQQGIGSLAGLLGSQTPAGEQAAAAGAFGTLGAGGLSLLASQLARNVGYNVSAQRQGAIDSTNYQANVLAELQRIIDDIEAQKQDILAQEPAQILAHLNELRDLTFNQNLARKEMAMRQAEFRSNQQSEKAFRKFTVGELKGAGAAGGGGAGGGAGGAGAGGPQPNRYSGYTRALTRFSSGELAKTNPNQRQRIRSGLREYKEEHPKAGSVQEMLKKIRRRRYGTFSPEAVL